MIGWIVSGVLALVSTAIVWYYRRRLSDTVQLQDLVTKNTDTLKNLNTLLAGLAKAANAAGTQDKVDAKNVTTADDAAEFLRHSLPTPDGGPKAGLRVAGRALAPCFVLGFGRAVRCHPASPRRSVSGPVVEG